MTDFPSRKLDQFVVRLPDGMRDRIKLAADANGRSMNGEIVATLLKAYPDPAVTLDMMKFIAAWMRKHANGVDVEDIAYGDYLRIASEHFFQQLGERE